MSFRKPAAIEDHALRFAAILFGFYLIRIPIVALVLALQTGSKSETVFLILRIINIFSYGINYFCPFYMFATALKHRESGFKTSFGFFAIYAAMELSYNLLLSIISYYNSTIEAIGSAVLACLAQWGIFCAAYLLLLIGCFFLLSPTRSAEPKFFFSLRFDESRALLLFGTLLVLEKVLPHQLIPLIKHLQSMLGPDSYIVKTYVLNIICYVLAGMIAFVAVRFAVSRRKLPCTLGKQPSRLSVYCKKKNHK